MPKRKNALGGNKAQIKTEYTTGSVSVLSLARKYDISPRVLKEIVRDEQWDKARDQYQSELYHAMVSKTMKARKSALDVIRHKVRCATGDILEQLEEISAGALLMVSMTPEETDELKKLQDMVLANEYMTKKQAERMFKLQKKAARVGSTLTPESCEKTLKALDQAYDLSEKTLGLVGVQPEVNITLNYVPDYLKQKKDRKK